MIYHSNRIQANKFVLCHLFIDLQFDSTKKCKIRPKSHTNNSCLEAKSETRTKFACYNCDPNGNIFDWINLSKSQVKVDRTVPFAYIFGIHGGVVYVCV